MTSRADSSLRQRLLAESKAMAARVLSEGQPLPPDLIAGLDRAAQGAPGDSTPEADTDARTAWLTSVHAYLSRLVAPARPGTLALLAREQGRLAFLGPVPSIRWLNIVAAISLLGFIVLGASGAARPGLFVSHPPVGTWQLLFATLFILCAASMGAAFALLYNLHACVARGEYEPAEDSSYTSAFLLGLLSGFVLAKLKLQLSADGVSAAGSTETGPHLLPQLTVAGLAFLGGFGARLTYAVLGQALLLLPESLRQGRARAGRIAGDWQLPVPPQPPPLFPDSSGLSDGQVQSANSYNQARTYSAELWKAVQALVGTTIDGIPGSDTAQKVAAWQSANGASPDGKAGPVTLSDMGIGPIFVDSAERAAFYFCSGQSIDADGAPNAYSPEDTGIDYLSNAGEPGRWWGCAVDRDGNPYVQGESDPCPGFYVSTTALVDVRYPESDPRRYVDSTRIPYLVLPKNIGAFLPASLAGSLAKGDLAAVAMVTAPEKVVFAIYADVGPAKTLTPDCPFGEGSIELCQSLGHDPYATTSARVVRASSGIAAGVVYVVFPGTGQRTPLSTEEIAERGQQAFDAWGGQPALAAAIAKLRAAGLS